VQLRAAEVGLGAVFLGRLRHRFSATSQLVELTLELPPLRSTLYLAAAKSALAIPRVRAVSDLLLSELSKVVVERRKH
jgi:hypothetical protein